MKDIENINIYPCLRYFEASHDWKNLVDTDAGTGDKIKMLLRDLGLGKETHFQYPWRPDGSPDLCADAHADFSSGSSITIKDATGKVIDAFPGRQCNEFIFTRA